MFPGELSQLLLITLKIYLMLQIILSRKDHGMRVDNGTRGKRHRYLFRLEEVRNEEKPCRWTLS